MKFYILPVLVKFVLAIHLLYQYSRHLESYGSTRYILAIILNCNTVPWSVELIQLLAGRDIPYTVQYLHGRYSKRVKTQKVLGETIGYWWWWSPWRVAWGRWDWHFCCTYSTTLRVQCQCHNIKYGIYQSMYDVEVDCNGNGGYIMYIIRDCNYSTTILRHYSSSSIETVIIAHTLLLMSWAGYIPIPVYSHTNVYWQLSHLTHSHPSTPTKHTYTGVENAGFTQLPVNSSPVARRSLLDMVMGDGDDVNLILVLG